MTDVFQISVDSPAPVQISQESNVYQVAFSTNVYQVVNESGTIQVVQSSPVVQVSQAVLTYEILTNPVPTYSLTGVSAIGPQGPTGPAGQSYTVDQPVTGTQNGINLIFATPDHFQAGSLRVYYNGILQHRMTDFAEIDSQSFSLILAPLASDVIVVEYLKL